VGIGIQNPVLYSMPVLSFSDQCPVYLDKASFTIDDGWGLKLLSKYSSSICSKVLPQKT